MTHSHRDYSPAVGKQVHLKDYDPEDTGGLAKEEALEEFSKLHEDMNRLQEMLYAQGKHSLLVVLQGMDTSGKDGTIKHVFDYVNPIGVRIASFKAPTPQELSYDFLWRIHQQVPPKGYIGIFNRSHYEDVLVVRVNELVPKSIWQQRYDQINAFERLLAETGTTILKFYLHISKDEQKRRLEARLADPEKQWKFSTGDLPVREKWADYMDAYEDALTRCNTEHARWHIVPANVKWYRNLVISRTIVHTLKKMDLQFPPPEPGLDKVVIPD